MSPYDETQPAAAYPPPSTGAGPYVVPPPPGYPTKDGDHGYAHQNHPSAETKSRGDCFCKGWCASLCCCSCEVDFCF